MEDITYLKNRFENMTEEDFGVEFIELINDEVISKFNNSDYSGTCCTGFAYSIFKMVSNKAKIFGFNTKENPTAEYFVNEAVCDGHDFAVIDNRYIIDPWLKFLPMVTNQVVFDLQNLDDENNITKYYGDPNKWTRNIYLENFIFHKYKFVTK
jgi:hypothetical protein